MIRLLPMVAVAVGLLVWTQTSLARDRDDRHDRDVKVYRYYDGGQLYSYRPYRNFSIRVPGFYFSYGRPYYYSYPYYYRYPIYRYYSYPYYPYYYPAYPYPYTYFYYSP